jgi:hypothetical protein
MLFRALLPAFSTAAIASGAVLAQSPQPADDAQNLPQKIHDELVSRGFREVRVVPQSFLISAKDQNGNPVMMLIGPNSMTVLSGPQPGEPNTAQDKDDKDKLIQQ